MKVQCIQPNIVYQKSNPTFNKNDKVIDEGDYVKVPKKQYKEDKRDLRLYNWFFIGMSVYYIIRIIIELRKPGPKI